MNGHDIARACASRGWEVFPVAVSYLPEGKTEKLPLVTWTTVATTTKATIDNWWGRWPAARCGIKTGAESGLYVIDIDSVEVDQDRLTAAGGVFTRTQRRGGWHVYFTTPEDELPIRNSAGDGVDVRGDGGFVVAWNFVEEELSPMPADIAEWARGRTRERRPEAAVDEFVTIRWPGGGSDEWVVRMVGQMRRAGWRPEAALAALLAENQQGRFAPPCEVAWLASKVRHVYDSYRQGVEVRPELLELFAQAG